MKKITYLLIATFLLSAFAVSAQKRLNNNLHTKNGTLVLEPNTEAFLSGFDLNTEVVYSGVFYKLIQFNTIPGEKTQEQLNLLGVKLLEYIPNFTYLAAIDHTININKLKRFNIRAIANVDEAFKLHPNLFNKTYPAHSLSGSNNIELVVSRYENITTNDAIKILLNANVEVVEYYPESRNIRLITTTDNIPLLAAFPFISYLEPVAPPAEPEDTRGRSLHRSSAINTIYASGRKYDGTGVKVAVNDDGFVGPHIDFTGRIDNSEVATDFTGTHGDGVGGIVGSAGNLNPSNIGMAPGVFQKIRQYNSSLPNTVTLHTSQQIMMFNSSYSNGTNAGYTTTTQLVDGEIYSNPSLIQIFSAGNSNGGGSTPAGTQWFNITGGHKAGKNVIATANLYYDDLLVSSSSRGPASDGRLKPDIASNGQNQISNSPDNTYQSFGGTSGAAPGIMGCAAQLYHAYKDLNAGVNPPSALIKASMMNTSHDLGNVGPDFKYGWGRINALRALRLIEDNRYFSSSVSQSGSNNHTIVIPANIAQVRVMVYWVDPAASTSAQQALVNDLDITLSDPSVTSHLPLILDPTPNATTLDLPAVPGVDTLNNVEQVRIDNPVAGSYTLNVSGTTVPFGPQEYFVVYEFIEDDIEVVYPIGGEGFVPGETEALRWDAHGSIGNFTIEYSTDNGSTWNFITNSVSGALRFYNWIVPSTLTGDALIKVSRGGKIDESIETFSIIGVPSGLTVDFACPDSIRLIWNAVAGATSYEVSQLGTMYMDSVGTSTTTSFIVTGINPIDEYWFSVKALGVGIQGRRAIAINKAPGTFACPVAIDGAVLSFVSPSGGVLLDCHNNSTVPVTVTIENKGQTPISNFNVSYRVNNGTITTETIVATLSPLSQVNHTFASTEDLSVAGIYNFESWTTVASDGNTFNDTSTTTVNVVASGIQTLPFTENFETFSTCGTANDCDLTICTLSNGFVNTTNGDGDDIDWRTDAGGTPSVGTGPSVDHNPGTSVGKYLYTEVSGSPVCVTATASMISPCLDLNGSSNTELRFWYHMDGVSMGSLHVDIFAGGTWTNDVMVPISGDQGSAWLLAVVDLSTYANQIINFRIRGITGTSWESDLAIDDISVFDAAAPPAVAFTASSTIDCPNKAIVFTDNSLNNPTSWTWTFSPNTVTFVNGTSASSQNPEVEFSAVGTYDVTLLASNTFGSNSLTQSSYININSAVALTVSEDFQSGFLPIGWNLTASASGLNWISNVVTGSNGLSTTAAYVNNYVNNLPGEESSILTMPIDLSTAEVPAVLFDVSYSPYSATLFDGLRIDISTDCGETYGPSGYFKENLVLATVPVNTASFFPTLASQWRRDTADLSSFAGMDANISFVNINGYGNGLFIDNIMVEDLCSGYDITSSILTNNTCFGGSIGSIDIELTAGTAPFTYNWSDGSSVQDPVNLAAGNYDVTVTDVNGCVRNGSYAITQGIEIIATTSKQNVNCNGAGDGTATVAAGGGVSPFTYSWNTIPVQTTSSISSLGPAFYTVTITDNIGCTKTSVVEVREPDLLIAFAIPTSPTSPNFNNGEINVLVSGGIAPYTYSWSNGANTEDIAGLVQSIYFCTVIDRRGCAVLVTVMLTNSFFAPNQIDRELSNNSSLLAKSTIYPNPTNGKLVVELVSDNESTLQIKLFDMKGALLIDKTQKLYVGMNEIKLNLTNYPPAKYLLKLGDDKAFLVRKIILEK